MKCIETHAKEQMSNASKEFAHNSREMAKLNAELAKLQDRQKHLGGVYAAFDDVLATLAEAPAVTRAVVEKCKEAGTPHIVEVAAVSEPVGGEESPPHPAEG